MTETEVPDLSQPDHAPGGKAGPEPSMRNRAIAGGTQILGRQVFGLALRSVGLLLLTRLIGPGNYGVYAASLAAVTLVSSLCRFGSEVYLIRLRDGDVAAAEQQVFSFLVVASTAVLLLGLPASLALGQLLDTEGMLVATALVVVIPVNVLWVPAQARLERELRYRELARIELAGDVVLYGVAVSVAVGGGGVWAPVCGYAAWQAWLLVASYRAAGFRPRWRWERSLLVPVLRYGSTYSPSYLVARAQDLVNPLVVGRYVGSVGVGHVALALRLVDNLGFVRRAVNQMALPTLARIQTDRPRLERAHREAMVVKILGVGVPLAGASLAMPVVLPVLVGDDWQGVSEVFPLLAVATVLGSPLALNAKLLNVVGRNLAVARAQALVLVALAALGFVLVPILGPAGYGWAGIGAVAPLVLLHRAVLPVLTPRYGPALRWSLAIVPLMFVPLVDAPPSLLLALPAVAVLARSDSRREVSHLARSLPQLRRRAAGTRR